VRSIVGRFLEHSRIFMFTNGGKRETYMGSADWMGRNLDHRVETIVPVLDASLQEQIRQFLDVLMTDNVKTRWLLHDGTYIRRVPEDGEPPFNAQEAFLRSAQTSG
jgi:polyphosphate kinase